MKTKLHNCCICLTSSIAEVLVGTLGLDSLRNPILVQWVGWVIDRGRGQILEFSRADLGVNAMMGIKNRNRNILAIGTNDSESKGEDGLRGRLCWIMFMDICMLVGNWTGSHRYKMTLGSPKWRG